MSWVQLVYGEDNARFEIPRAQPDELLLLQETCEFMNTRTVTQGVEVVALLTAQGAEEEHHHSERGNFSQDRIAMAMRENEHFSSK